MFGTIRKHSTTLWWFVIVLIIVSFVIFFTPNVGSDRARSSATIQIDGADFTREDLIQAMQEERLFRMLTQNTQAPSNQEENLRGMQRLLLKRLIANYGIEVGNETVATWIRDRLLKEGAAFSGMTYEQVVNQILVPQRFSANLLQEFARTEAGREILMRSIGSVGVLVTPDEVRSAFLRDNSMLPVDVAYVANSNFLSKVVLKPDELMQFYSNRVAAYRSPDRVQVSYVRLANSNYLAEAETALKADERFEIQVTQIYEQRGTNFYEGLEIEEAKGRIRQEIMDQQAMDLAKRRAYEFANTYWDSDPKNTAAMDAAAQKIGLSAKQAEPVARGESPADVAGGPDFAKAAFELTAEEPFSLPVQGLDGYYTLCFEKRISGKVLPFDEVKDRVEKEYREERARTMAQEAADKFREAVTGQDTDAQGFVNLAKLSGLQVASITNLSLRTELAPEGFDIPVELRRITSIAFSMDANSVSEPQFAADGIMILRVGETFEPDPAAIAEGIKEYSEIMQSTRETEAFREWFTRQVEKSGIMASFQNAP